MMRKFRNIVLLLLILPLCRVSPVTAGGSDSSGYIAEDGEVIVLEGNIIDPTSYSNGLWAKPNGVIILTNGSVATNNTQKPAVYSSGGTINLNSVDIMSPTQSSLCHGIEAESGGVVNMTGGSIVTDKYYSFGVVASNISVVNLTDVEVTTRGWYGLGVVAYSGSQIIMNGGSITTYDKNSGGVGTLYDSFGAYANGSGSVVTLNNVDMATYGSVAQGAWALAVDDGGKVVMNGGSIYTEGLRSYGLALLIGDILVTDVSIETRNNYTHGAYGYFYGSHTELTDTDIRTYGNESHGLLAWDGADTEMTGGSISTSGDKAYGVNSQNTNYADAKITVSDALICTSGASAHALRANNGGIIDASGLTIKVNDSLGSCAIYANGNSDYAVSRIYGSESVFNVCGAIVAENYGSIDITLGDGSYLYGRTSVADTLSELEMRITGAGSKWDVTSNSTLTGLTLNDSLVDYRNAALETVITVENLNSGYTDSGGSLFMKTDIASEKADLLIVTGATSGFHTITVRNDGRSAATGDEVTLLVRTADRNGSFALSRYVDAGGWRYGLEHNTADYGDGAGWELVAMGPSPGGNGGVNAFYASYLLSYAEMDTLIKRLGDLRQTDDEQGLWVRLHGGGFKSNSRSYARPFDMDYYGIHIGYDRKIDMDWDGGAYAGIMFGYSKGDLDYGDGGTGEIDSKMVGLYGTWIYPGGFFADLVLKYQWTDNDMDVFESDGARVTGNGVSTGGFGASLELGQRIHFAKDKEETGKDKDSGWYMEPQVQLSYLRQDGGYFRASNGLRVGVDGYTALLGRLGVLVGYENDARTRNFYAKVSKVKDFQGDIVVRMNGDSFPYRFGSNWWVYGVGFTAKLNDRNSLYLDLERTSGAYFSQDWAIKAGWRKTF